MGVSLSKGQKVDLTKSNPRLTHLVVGLGWEANSYGGPAHDIDASAFLLGDNQKVTSDRDFVFYNNPQGGSGSVIYSGDNRSGFGQGDKEQIQIDLPSVPSLIHRIAFTITIHDADFKRQNFGQVQNAYVRVFDQQNGTELIYYNLGQDFRVETAIVAAEVYRHNGEWKFAAIGSGFGGGLAALCRNFGIEVDDPAPSSNTSQLSYLQDHRPTPYQSSTQQSPYTGYGNMNQNQNYNHQGYRNLQGYNNQGYRNEGFGSPQLPMGNPYGGNRPLQQQDFQGQINYNPSYSGDYRCKKCGSTDIRSGKKGFGVGKAAIGGLLLGPVGLLGGFIGGNKLKLTCNTCGFEYEPNSGEIANMTNELKYKTMQLIRQNKTPEVLNAITSGLALVATADGVLDPSEREKVYEFVNQSEELRAFGSQQVLNRFDYFVNLINRDSYSGKASALRSVGKVRQKPGIGSLIIRYGIALGYADGFFAPEEKQIIAQMCRELGLDPNEYLSAT